MIDFSKIIRPHILHLKPYTTARDDFKGVAEIYVDANENPHGSVVHGPYSRYPDPHQEELREALASYKGQPKDTIFMGHGSDECIELLVRAVGRQEEQSIAVFPPTYGMYKISAEINNIGVTEIPLRSDFSLDIEAIRRAITSQTKALFVCSPNNPTGAVQSVEQIKELCQLFSGLVVVDEAYSDFCPEKSVLSLRSQYRNLVVIQTFSKAWGMPALRLGVLYGDVELCRALSKIKPPYNIGSHPQKIAVQALRKVARMEKIVSKIVLDREWLREKLSEIPAVKKVEPSDANFLLVRFTDAEKAFKGMLQRGIVARDRSNQPLCEGGVRISVGTPRENAKIVSAIREIFNCNDSKSVSNESGSCRISQIRRYTNETKIEVELNLDGTGESYCSTGLSFLDHMLDQVARHSGMDLSISVQGDLDIDEHHTTEDLGLALGSALKEALGDKRGIERYGFVAPMDEAEANVSLDFSGRAHLVFSADFKREYVGDLPTELIEHFFYSIAQNAQLTLHISAKGENDHHIIESIFKGFARALRQAIRRGASETVPSTKGVL